MMGGVWFVGAALVAVGVAGGWAWVRRRAALMEQRVRLLLADELEPRSSFPSLVSIPARHERTVFASDLSDPLFRGFPAGIDVELQVSESEIVVQHDASTPAWIPLRRVKETTFVASFLEREAPDGGALLRIVWNRGGETLWTVFRVDAWVEAEKVRQQVHLRSQGWRR